MFRTGLRSRTRQDVKRRLFIKTERAPEMRHGSIVTTTIETDRTRRRREAASDSRGVLHLLEKLGGRE